MCEGESQFEGGGDRAVESYRASCVRECVNCFHKKILEPKDLIGEKIKDM